MLAVAVAVGLVLAPLVAGVWMMLFPGQGDGSVGRPGGAWAPRNAQRGAPLNEAARRSSIPPSSCSDAVPVADPDQPGWEVGRAF